MRLIWFFCNTFLDKIALMGAYTSFIFWRLPNENFRLFFAFTKSNSDKNNAIKNSVTHTYPHVVTFYFGTNFSVMPLNFHCFHSCPCFLYMTSPSQSKNTIVHLFTINMTFTSGPPSPILLLLWSLFHQSKISIYFLYYLKMCVCDDGAVIVNSWKQ